MAHSYRFRDIAKRLAAIGVPQGSVPYVISKMKAGKVGRGLYGGLAVDEWFKKVEGKRWEDINNRARHEAAAPEVSLPQTSDPEPRPKHPRPAPVTEPPQEGKTLETYSTKQAKEVLGISEPYFYILAKRRGFARAGYGIWHKAPIDAEAKRRAEGKRGFGNESKGLYIPKKVYKEEVRLTREEVSRRTGISQSEVPHVFGILGADQDDERYAESLVNELMGDPEVLKSRARLNGENVFFGFLRYRTQQLSEFLPGDAVNRFTLNRRMAQRSDVPGHEVAEFFYRNGDWTTLGKLGYEKKHIEQKLAGDRSAYRKLYSRAGPSI